MRLFVSSHLAVQADSLFSTAAVNVTCLSILLFGKRRMDKQVHPPVGHLALKQPLTQHRLKSHDKIEQSSC